MRAYIVSVHYQYQDGHDDHVYLFGTMDEALTWIEKSANQTGGQGHTYELFELGKQIPIGFEKRLTAPEPLPPVERYIPTIQKKSKAKGDAT